MNSQCAELAQYIYSLKKPPNPNLLPQLILWKLAISNNDLSVNWVEIPSVAINIPLEGSLMIFFCLYCCGNPILHRDRTISMCQSSGPLLDGGVGRSDWLLRPAPASGLPSPQGFRPRFFWRGKVTVQSAV